MDYDTEWDDNLRVNLRLWPEPASNVSALARQHGEVYDEAELIKGLARDGIKTPADPRAVRNTFEGLACAGLAYRSDENPQRLLLTPLGKTALSFVGALESERFARAANQRLLGAHLVRALSLIIEVRAIWELMLRCGGRLSNEELNRCMNRVHRLSDVEAAALAVQRGREKDDPTAIGQRLYKEEDYGTALESDQRKAMNPHFLLAGGGGWLIDVSQSDPFRRVPSWAVPLMERALDTSPPLAHASTDRALAQRMSIYSGVRI